MFVDTHCHLQDDKLVDNVEDVINSALDNNVRFMVVNGYDTKSNEKALEFSDKYEPIYVAIGYHPTEQEDVDIKYLESVINSSKVVAIGEIGLDYYYTKDNRDQQIKKFEQQLELAIRYDKPVIIHNRNATDDMYHILKKYKGKIRGIIHCFSGSIETARMFIELGFLLGIGGGLTFKNSTLGNVIKEISLNNIVLETDSPYLTPEPYRKYLNEPKYVVEVAKYLSNLYEVDLDTIAEVTTKNALELFGI